MKRVFVLALAVAFAPLAGAQLYKYVDKDGKTVYTDQPPANVQAKPVEAPPPPPMPAAAAGSKNGTNGNKSAVERDKDNEKNREQAREQQKKQQEASEKAQQAEQRCTQARSAFNQYSEGGRLLKYNDKGERVYMSDEEIASSRDKARQEMDEACKKS
jgi:hypothetical protein